MIPSHYAALELGGVSLEELRDEYLDWILGHGEYGRKRRDRENLGVHREWTRSSLVSTRTSTGLYDCAVAVRQDDDTFVLRFTHRDHADQSVLWHTMVRGSDLRSGVKLEHGVARSFPRGVVLQDVAAPPQVLRRIAERKGIELRRPKSLLHKQVLLKVDDVDTFVRHVLTDPARELPHVLVSTREGGGPPLVDPAELAKSLRTLAAVVVFEDGDASREFGRAMTAAGFPERFGHCYHGAVRLYESPLQREQNPYQHYLWLGERILEMSSGGRTKELAGEIASRCASARTPPGFFRAIEVFDRKQVFERAGRLLERTAESVKDSSDLAAALSQRDGELEELRSSLEVALAEQGIWEKEAAERETEVGDLRRRVEQVEQERDDARARTSSIERALVASQERDGGLDDRMRDAHLAAISGEPTLEQGLLVLQRLYSDRVVVLRSATESARASVTFRKRKKAFELLSRLVTDYWDRFREAGDVKARQVFGNEQFSATESERVTSNANAVRLRTFTYEGRQVQMLRHLKIGTKDSVADTLRVHFHVVEREENGEKLPKIVIGHCGCHLDFK